MFPKAQKGIKKKIYNSFALDTLFQAGCDMKKLRCRCKRRLRPLPRDYTSLIEGTKARSCRAEPENGPKLKTINMQ